MIRHRPSLVRSRTARACGSSIADTGHAAGRFRVGGDRPFDQGGGGLFPLGRQICGELGAGDGLHQAVHQDQASPAG